MSDDRKLLERMYISDTIKHYEYLITALDHAENCDVFSEHDHLREALRQAQQMLMTAAERQYEHLDQLSICGLEGFMDLYDQDDLMK